MPLTNPCQRHTDHQPDQWIPNTAYRSVQVRKGRFGSSLILETTAIGKQDFLRHLNSLTPQAVVAPRSLSGMPVLH